MKLRILAVSSKKRKSSQKLKKTEKTKIKTEKQITVYTLMTLITDPR